MNESERDGRRAGIPLGRGVALAGLGLALAGRELYRRRRYGDLWGEVALVTGATRGLGLLLAEELAEEGCRLAIAARDGAELERARARLEGRGATVLTLRGDVSVREEAEGLVARATDHYGRVDLLVNNAGAITAGPAPAMTVEDFRDALGVMFWGTVYPTLAVLPQMRARRRGRIVAITSVGGKVAIPHLLPYATAKFAATAFAEGLRAEVARDGITVTAVAPGLMRTGSVLNAYFKGQPEREFAPFAVLSSLPFVTLDAGNAARQVVRAIKRGEAERVLGGPAGVLAAFHGLLPGVTADILGAINRLLPRQAAEGRPGPEGPVRGMELHERVRSGPFDFLVGWSLSAARALHQYPGPVGVAGPGPGTAAGAGAGSDGAARPAPVSAGAGGAP